MGDASSQSCTLRLGPRAGAHIVASGGQDERSDLMKVKLTILLAALTASLTLAGTATAAVVDEGGSEGNTPGFTLAATRTTTAFAVGTWTYSPGPVTVEWFTNCGFPQNDRNGQVVLNSGQSVVVFEASRQVGAPFAGWDTCSITAFYTADFGENQDGTLVHSAVTGWLVSHQ